MAFLTSILRFNMKVRDITHVATLTAVSIILGIIESYIPSIGIPGVKLGLANIAIVITLFGYGWYYALIVNILRVFIVSLIRGTIFQMGFFMSLTGAILSLSIMILCKLFLKKLHIVSVSVLGSIFHVGGQIIIAIIFTSTPGIIYYFPFLLLTSIITGIIVGFISNACLKLPIFSNKQISN